MRTYYGCDGVGVVVGETEGCPEEEGFGNERNAFAMVSASFRATRRFSMDVLIFVCASLSAWLFAWNFT